MNYCSKCGQPVRRETPAGDNRERDVCGACGTVHYVNPTVVLGCVPTWNDKILLCKRAIEPRYGYWTVPAGFMEVGETMAQGAARETREEALAEVEIGDLLALVDVIRARQVHVFFRAFLRTDQYGAGEESLETELFDEKDIPWDDIAFPSVTYALQRFIDDRRRGASDVHITAMGWPPTA